jgi:phage baseplate assembly protein W
MANTISLAHLGVGLAESSTNRTMLFDITNDLALTSNPLENFANAIWRRLMTPLAFYPEYPEYGSQLNLLIGMPFVPETISLAEIYVTQALAKEPRVESIENVRVNPTGYRALSIYAAIKPASAPNVYIMTFDYFMAG